jgi:hypothetical protein
MIVHRITPEKYRSNNNLVSDKGRILANDEYTIPNKVITEDPLFEKYQLVS